MERVTRRRGPRPAHGRLASIRQQPLMSIFASSADRMTLGIVSCVITMVKSKGPANGTLLIVGGLVTPTIAQRAIELGGAQWVVIPTAQGQESYDHSHPSLRGIPPKKFALLHTNDRTQANSESLWRPSRRRLRFGSPVDGNFILLIPTRIHVRS